jgi:hypothetical protein
MDKETTQARFDVILSLIEQRLVGSVDRHNDDWASIVGGKYGLSHLNIVQRGRDFRLEVTLGTLAVRVDPGQPIAMAPLAIDATDESDEAVVSRILGGEPHESYSTAHPGD